MGKEVNKHWVFYTRFGLNLKAERDDFITTCPFCLKDRHFGIKQSSGVAACLRCGISVNHYSFIREFHQLCLSTTTDRDYQELSLNRGLSVAVLKIAQLAKSPSGNWLIPSRNEQGVIMNLYQGIPYDDEGTPGNNLRIPHGQSPASGTGNGASRRPPVAPVRPPVAPVGILQQKFRIESASDPCQQMLYGLELITNQQTIIVCEGHWDRLALWDCFARLSPTLSRNPGCLDMDVNTLEQPNFYGPLLQEIAILGAPGANQFKADWCQYLKHKNVILIYDNDKDRVICPTCRGREGYKAHLIATPCPLCGGTKTTGQVINPGRDGMNKVVKELDETGTAVNSLLHVRWLPSDPKDVRDLVML